LINSEGETPREKHQQNACGAEDARHIISEQAEKAGVPGVRYTE
jgi:hypothetical protein